jgi:hypothetical protein
MESLGLILPWFTWKGYCSHIHCRGSLCCWCFCLWLCLLKYEGKQLFNTPLFRNWDYWHDAWKVCKTLTQEIRANCNNAHVNGRENKTDPKLPIKT